MDLKFLNFPTPIKLLREKFFVIVFLLSVK